MTRSCLATIPDFTKNQISQQPPLRQGWGELDTQPRRRISFARRYAKGRKPTPCTAPRITTRSRSFSPVFSMCFLRTFQSDCRLAARGGQADYAPWRPGGQSPSQGVANGWASLTFPLGNGRFENDQVSTDCNSAPHPAGSEMKNPTDPRGLRTHVARQRVYLSPARMALRPLAWQQRVVPSIRAILPRDG